MRAARTYSLGLFFFTLCWLGYDHYRPWTNFHSELVAFLGLFFLVASVLLYRCQSVELPRVSFWIILSVAVSWAQYATGITSFAGDSLMTSLYLLGLLCAISVGYSFCRPNSGQAERGPLGLMHCLWIAAIVSGAIGLAQWFGVQEPLAMYVVQADLGDRAMGNLGQANQLATLLLMGMAAYAFVFERGVIGRLVFFVGIGFLTLVLVLSQSRAGMLSVVVIVIFACLKVNTFKSRISPKMVIFWLLSFVLGTLLLPYFNEVLLNASVRSIADAGPVSERWRMWQQVMYAVFQSPWVGYGWNNTPSAHAAGAVAFPGSGNFTYAHNFIVDLLAWNGLILGLLLAGAIVYWFVTRIVASKRIDTIYAMACLLPVAVHSMLEYPFAYAYFLIAAGFMVGIVEAGLPPTKTLRVPSRIGWGVLVFCASVTSYITYEYLLIEEDFRVVRFENLRVGVTPSDYEVPRLWMLSHMAAMLKAGRQTAKPDMSKVDIDRLRKVADRFSYGAVRLRYAQALALNGDAREANQQMAIIRGMYGAGYYAACKEEIRRLQTEKYPQLANIALTD